MTFVWTDYALAVPEMFLASWALLLLVVGVFAHPQHAARQVNILAAVGLGIGILLVLRDWVPGTIQYAFPRLPDGRAPMFVVDDFSTFAKLAILSFSAVALVFMQAFYPRYKQARPEHAVLVLLANVGMLLMCSAADVLTLYVGLEMMSFCLYILAASLRDNAKSAEAGLKYFTLGSLASCLLLLGLSLLYGVSADTSLSGIRTALETALQGNTAGQLPVYIAVVLVLVALCFKLAVVPFHLWAPDVYEGAPTPITAFMAVVAKFAAFVLLLRIVFGAFDPAWGVVQNMLIPLAVLSMVAGALFAIVQSNVKRLLAFSSIGHVGFMLTGVVAGGVVGAGAVGFYLVVYGLTVLTLFAVIHTLTSKGVEFEKISDFSGLARRTPVLAAVMLVALFSLAGIPPFAGFWAKWMVFSAAVGAGHVWLVVVGVLSSAIACYYSLKIVQVMYFEEGGLVPDNNNSSLLLRLAVALSVLVVLIGLLPGLLMDMASTAAKALF